MTKSNYNYRKPIDNSEISDKIFQAKKGIDYFWMEKSSGYSHKK
jgi:hypothetical protein